MTVWSITPFLNELDLLELRLRELDDVVDVHVISESPVTYRGDAKPLWFAEHRERFAEWLPKIRYVVTSRVEPVPFQAFGDQDRWRRENGQRAALRDALYGMGDSDVVILSDLDEIPRAAMIGAYASSRYPVVFQPRIPMYLYRLGLRIDAPQASLLRMFRGSLLRGYSPEMIRRMPTRTLDPEHHPSEWGWHFSYFGGVDAVRYKVRQAAHPEEEVGEWLTRSNLHQCIVMGRDHRGNRSHRVVYDAEDLPVAALDRERFATLWDPIVHPASYDPVVAPSQAGRPDSWGASRPAVPHA